MLSSLLSRQNIHSELDSKMDLSLQQYGHFVSTTPAPQHSQDTVPSGETPRNGKTGLGHWLHGETLCVVCHFG